MVILWQINDICVYLSFLDTPYFIDFMLMYAMVRLSFYFWRFGRGEGVITKRFGLRKELNLSLTTFILFENRQFRPFLHERLRSFVRATVTFIKNAT
jgi:hypothetical protein